MQNSDIVSLKRFTSKFDFKSNHAYEILFDAFTQRFAMPIILIKLKDRSYTFRSRINGKGENYFDYGNLSYPNKKFVKNYSRANIPSQSVFYCSDNFATNLTELMPNWINIASPGETFTITTGMWEFRKELLITVIPDFENERLMKLISKIPELHTGSIELEYWDYINSFFRDQGINTPDVYKFTSAFCNALVYNAMRIGEKVEGILYTSIQDSSGWNLALSPKFVDNNLILSDVTKHFITRREDKNGKPNYDNTNGSFISAKLDSSSRKIIW